MEIVGFEDVQMAQQVEEWVAFVSDQPAGLEKTNHGLVTIAGEERYGW